MNRTTLQKFYEWLIATSNMNRPISEMLDLWDLYQVETKKVITVEPSEPPVDELPQYHKPHMH